MRLTNTLYLYMYRCFYIFFEIKDLFDLCVN